MIENSVDISRGMVVVHDEGLTYCVEDVRMSTAGYEQSHELGARVVNYVQLEEGSYPPGTKWSKPEGEFRQHFTISQQDQ